jgi:hypothetical protein
MIILITTPAARTTVGSGGLMAGMVAEMEAVAVISATPSNFRWSGTVSGCGANAGAIVHSRRRLGRAGRPLNLDVSRREAAR